MEDLLIENGIIVRSNEMFYGSIAISNEKITAVYHDGESLPKAKNVIDAKEFMVFPGMIDTHIHLNEPGITHHEDIAHGTAAAAIGGITTVIDMPNLSIPPVYNVESLKKKLECIKNSAVTDVALWASLFPDNFDQLEELYNEGVCAFKSFMCDPENLLAPNQIEEAMSIIKSFGGVAGFRCEDMDILNQLTAEKEAQCLDSRKDYLETRPVEAELTAVKKLISIAKKTGCTTYICHTSHPMVAHEIQKARKEGYPIYGETCPHYFLFSQDDYLQKGGAYKCCPPLRDRKAATELLDCLVEGSLQTLGSDHCPVTLEEKDESKYGYINLHNGMGGCQSMVQATFDYMIHQKHLNPTLLASVFSTNAAKIFGLYGQKGDLLPGFDADVTIIDPNEPWEVKQEELLYVNRFSAYDGLKGIGCPVITLLRGKVIAMNGEIIGTNSGKYVKRYR